MNSDNEFKYVYATVDRNDLVGCYKKNNGATGSVIPKDWDREATDEELQKFIAVRVGCNPEQVEIRRRGYATIRA